MIKGAQRRRLEAETRQAALSAYEGGAIGAKKLLEVVDGTVSNKDRAAARQVLDGASDQRTARLASDLTAAIRRQLDSQGFWETFTASWNDNPDPRAVEVLDASRDAYGTGVINQPTHELIRDGALGGRVTDKLTDQVGATRDQYEQDAKSLWVPHCDDVKPPRADELGFDGFRLQQDRRRTIGRLSKAILSQRAESK